MNAEQRKRLYQFFRKAAILFLIGLAYYLFVKLTGWGIPCPIRMITGTVCPGCGISRMCMALLELDFVNALRYNALVLFLLPFGAVFGLRRLIIYVRTGNTEPDKVETVFLLITAVFVFLFWILRNLPNSPFPEI